MVHRCRALVVLVLPPTTMAAATAAAAAGRSAADDDEEMAFVLTQLETFKLSPGVAAAAAKMVETAVAQVRAAGGDPQKSALRIAAKAAIAAQQASTAAITVKMGWRAVRTNLRHLASKGSGASLPTPVVAGRTGAVTYTGVGEAATGTLAPPSMTVVHDLLTAAVGKVNLEKLAAAVDVLGGAYNAAMEFATLPVEQRLEVMKKEAATVWTHKVYGALLDAVAGTISTFEGSLGHHVHLTTTALVERRPAARAPRRVAGGSSGGGGGGGGGGTGAAGTGTTGGDMIVEGFAAVADFAHISAVYSYEGNVVNTRSHHVLKRNIADAVVDGIPQVEGQGCLRLLHLETVCGAVDPATGIANDLHRVAYGVASDAYYLYLLKTSIEVDERGVPRLVTAVSPALPLWPAAVMEAAYPPAAAGAPAAAAAAAAEDRVSVAKAAAMAAAIAEAVTTEEVDAAAAVVATAQGITQAAAAAMVRDVPLGALVLACLLAADREFLGAVPAIVPTGSVPFRLPPDTVNLTDMEADWREPAVVLDDWSRVLGSGGFSDTFRVTWPGCPDGSCVAKFVRRPTTSSAKLLQEAAACMRLRHSVYVPALLGGYWSEGEGEGAEAPVLSALVLAPVGGTLWNVLVDLDGAARLAVLVHAVDAVLRALVDSHAVGVAHNDVHAQNVVVHRFPPPRRAARAAAAAAVVAAAVGTAAAGAASEVAARRSVFAMLSDWGLATLSGCTDAEKAEDVTSAIGLLEIGRLVGVGDVPRDMVAAVNHVQWAVTAADALARLEPLRVRLAIALPDWARAGTE